MLLRELTCPCCGAPRTTTADALVVLCRYCGAVMTMTGDGNWRETALLDRQSAGVQQMVRPTAAQARLSVVSAEMQEARTPAMRDHWRALAEEQLLLMAVAFPNHGPSLPSDPRARASHVAAAVATTELATFDPSIAAHLLAYTTEAARMVQSPDPVATATRMLATARAYYQALIDHPSLPPGMLREGADHLARDMVRTALKAYALLLGANVLERIRIAVLGDRDAPSNCPSCGAALAAGAIERCRHCGAVTEVATEDAWTTAQLAMWTVMKQDLVRRGHLNGPEPALTAVSGFVYTAARDVPPERAFAFLQRAVPWLSAPEVDQALALVSQAAPLEAQTLIARLRTLVAERWITRPDDKPVRHAERTDFVPPTPADEDAWIGSALTTWPTNAGLLQLLACPLGAIHLAAMHEQPTGVSPRAAMTFFTRAQPTYDRAQMLVELRKTAPGYTHPRVQAFVAELCQYLANEAR